MHDVIVVGGGPGGLHAALRLARDGYDVALLEEHGAAGTPVHCTGVLAAEAYDEFELPREAILNTLRTARFCSPGGCAVEYTTPSLEVLVVDRPVFDRALHDRARWAGVAIELGVKVTAVDLGAKDVVVRCGDGSTRRARACVLACGASYAMQRQLGLGAPGVFLQSGQIELPVARTGHVEVHFGRSVAPKGFAWIVPVRRPGGEFARVGVMCGHQAARYLSRFIARIGDAWGVGESVSLQPSAFSFQPSAISCQPSAISRQRAAQGSPSTLRTASTPGTLGTSSTHAQSAHARFKLLPLSPIRRTFSDRLLAVGDAAGLVKATTGGGIYYTLVSADLAASVLSTALRRDTLAAETLQKYEAEWRRRLGAELRAQHALRTLAHWLTDTDIEALFELARTDGVMPLVHRFARFNHHRELILSLFRHPPARRVLLRQLLANRLSLSAQ